MRRKKIADKPVRQPTHEPEKPDQTTKQEIKIPQEQLREQEELASAEEEIIRLMLLFGQETLIEEDETTDEAKLTVAGFIINELSADELDLQQPLLYKIFEEYRQLIHTVNDMYFLQHHDPEVSSLAASFEPKYVLSKIHYRNGATVKTDENNLLKVVPNGVLAYKNKRVMKRLKEVSLAMKQAESDNDLSLFETLFIQYNELTKVKKKIGQTLGKRIIY